MINLK